MPTLILSRTADGITLRASVVNGYLCITLNRPGVQPPTTLELSPAEVDRLRALLEETKRSTPCTAT